MRFPPLPGALHNALEIAIARLPAELLLDFFRTRHQHRRIARAPRRYSRRYRMAGHAADRLNHFTHAEALAVAQVVNEAVFFLERLEHQQVCLAEIADVDVVADAGTVRRRVVVAENGKLFAFAERHFEGNGDQVRLRLMILSLCPGRARYVEISQRSVAQAVNAVEP